MRRMNSITARLSTTVAGHAALCHFRQNFGRRKWWLVAIVVFLALLAWATAALHILRGPRLLSILVARFSELQSSSDLYRQQCCLSIVSLLY